jgi:hypothetical protein
MLKASRKGISIGSPLGDLHDLSCTIIRTELPGAGRVSLLHQRPRNGTWPTFDNQEVSYTISTLSIFSTVSVKLHITDCQPTCTKRCG